MRHEEEKIIEKLSSTADQLDGIEVTTPSIQNFRELVDRQQAKVKRAERLQLGLFVLVASLILAGVVFLTGRHELFFLLLQAVSLTGSVISLAVFFARKPKEGTAR